MGRKGESEKDSKGLVAIRDGLHRIDDQVALIVELIGMMDQTTMRVPIAALKTAVLNLEESRSTVRKGADEVLAEMARLKVSINKLKGRDPEEGTENGEEEKCNTGVPNS